MDMDLCNWELERETPEKNWDQATLVSPLPLLAAPLVADALVVLAGKVMARHSGPPGAASIGGDPGI